jgi:hypothetical protein
LAGEIIAPDVLVSRDEEKRITMHSGGRPLALELKDHDTIVMTCREEVDLRMGRNYPEAVILSLEALNRSPLVQIPNPHGLVLSDG